MAIKSINEKPRSGKIDIDLTGPDGNAFFLMGIASRINRDLDLGYDMENVIIPEMISGDYENLLSVMEKYFGDYIIMYR